MKMSRVIISVLTIFFVAASWAGGNQIKVQSVYGFNQTVDRYLAALDEAGIPVMDKKLETDNKQVILFTNPFFGTSIGRCHRGERKDEPLQAIINKDQNGAVWVAYERPIAHINDFGVIECGNETDQMSRALQKFATVATGP